MTPWLWLGYVMATGVGLAVVGASALLVWALWHVVRGWLETGDLDAVGAAQETNE